MIAFIVGNASGDKFRVMRNGCIDWTRDLTKALRFARREDAESFCEEDEAAWRIMQVIMGDCEQLQAIRVAIAEAEDLADKVAHMDSEPWWKLSRQARTLQRRADNARIAAMELCYNFFKEVK